MALSSRPARARSPDTAGGTREKTCRSLYRPLRARSEARWRCCWCRGAAFRDSRRDDLPADGGAASRFGRSIRRAVARTTHANDTKLIAIVAESPQGEHDAQVGKVLPPAHDRDPDDRRTRDVFEHRFDDHASKATHDEREIDAIDLEREFPVLACKPIVRGRLRSCAAGSVQFCAARPARFPESRGASRPPFRCPTGSGADNALG